MRTDSSRRALVVAATLLAGCTDHPTPGEPQFEVWPEIRGIITSGAEPGMYVTVSGATGIKRVISVRDSLGHYVSAVAELGLPYRVDGGTESGMIPLVALGFDTGLVNVTPLTTLAASQALSEFDIGDLTEPRLLEAQQRMATYLQATYGVASPSSGVNWSSIDFVAEPGDPMFDQINLLTSTIEGAGESIAGIVERLAQQGALCRQQKLTYGGSRTGVFCPATRVSTPDSSDASIVTYSFITQDNDSLVVQTAGGTITRADLYPHDGEPLSCTSCTGLVVGTRGVAGDRPLTFTATALQGAAAVTLTGTIIAAPDGVTLPPLYCTDRRFLMIKPDRTAVGDCFGEFPGGVSFAAGRKTWYHFGSSGWGFEIDTDMDNNVLSLVYTEYDENFQQTARFACELAGCAGITIGPLVTDVNWGSTRRLTLQDARLAQVLPDSSLSTTTFAVANYSAVMMTLDGMDPNPIPPCDYSIDSVVVTGSDGIPPYSLCPPPTDPENFVFKRQSYVQEDGAPAVFAQDDQLHSISVMFETDGTTIRQVLWQGGNVMGLTGNCVGSACQGVTVTAPDSEGRQTMTFNNTLLREPRLYGVKLTTARTITVNGSIGDIIPAPGFSPPPPAGPKPRINARSPR